MKIITFLVVVVLLDNMALAQPSPNHTPQTAPANKSSIATPTPVPQNPELDAIKAQLAELREKLAASDAREQIRTEALYNRLGWTGLLFGGLGIALGFITLSPFMGGFILWLLRKNIYREIAKPIEEEIDKDINDTKAEVTQLKTDIIPKLQSQAQGLESKYEEVKLEIRTAGELINRVKKQLDIGLAPGDEIRNLKQDITQSPSFLQDNIFYIAKDFIIDNFRRRTRLKELEKAIPVFEAIIASDGGEQYFRSRAYSAYGYAYKDAPNFDEAINKLNEAITIRDKLSDNRPEFYFYEFKRAIFKMQKYGCTHDNARVNDEHCSLEVTTDLETAKQYPIVAKILIERVQSDCIFEQDFDGRYLTESEFNLLKKWYEQNPDISRVLEPYNNPAAPERS